ncbi:MAG: hypothetical protein U0350_21080 [Caldilineaceae bacterium]
MPRPVIKLTDFDLQSTVERLRGASVRAASTNHAAPAELVNMAF